MSLAHACCLLPAASGAYHSPPSPSTSYSRLTPPRAALWTVRHQQPHHQQQSHRQCGQQQQQQRQRRRRLEAFSSGSGGGSSSQEETMFERALQEYDSFIEAAKETLEEGEVALKELDDELAKMRQENVLPRWVFSLAIWTRKVNQLQVDYSERKYQALKDRRGDVADALRTLEADLATSPPLMDPDPLAGDFLALAAYAWAQREEEGAEQGQEQLQQALRAAVEQTSGPNRLVWACVVSSLFTAYAAGWIGTWGGYDAYRLTHDAPSVGAAAAWLAWTAPYVAGTLWSHSMAPSVFSKSVIRPLATDQQTFFRKLPFVAAVPCVLVVAFCQCLVYQGLWQDVFTSWLGGVRDPMLVTDPSSALLGTDQQAAVLMGTLAGGLRMPAFVLAPSAAVLTGALEGYWYWAALTLRDSTTVIQLGNERMEAKEWMEGGPGGSVRPTDITSDERLAICARVALSSAWLCLETTVTGNLWLAVGTSAAGLITSVLLAQQGGGGAGSMGARRT